MAGSRSWLPIAAVAATSWMIAQVGFATEVTVQSTGGADFTTIQAALDSIQKGPLGKDGTPDVITILDSATYNEQLNIGNIPSLSEHPGTKEAWLAETTPSNLDPITIQGAEGEEPVLQYVGTELVDYGVFPDDPGDMFKANVAYLGTSITFRRVVFNYTPEIGDAGAYMLNGQARDLVFEDVLFKYDDDPNTFSGESYINLNNSDILAREEGIDNSNTVLRNCIVDGTQAIIYRTGDEFLYFHGFDSLGDTPLTPSVLVEGTTFTMWPECIRMRGRPADREYTTITSVGSYFWQNGNCLRVEGNGMIRVDQTLFTRNMNDWDIGRDGGIIYLAERSGWCPAAEISNSIFYNNGGFDLGGEDGTSPHAAIRVRARTDGNTGPVVVDHCTFDSNGRVIWLSDPDHPRELIVSNSIFTNTEFSLLDMTPLAATPELVSGSIDAVLGFQNTANMVPGEVTFPNLNIGDFFESDPLFDPATVNIDTNAPWALPAFQLTEPSPAVDRGNDALTLGTFDVDGDPRFSRDASDLGAQELDLGPPTSDLEPPVVTAITTEAGGIRVTWTGTATAYQVQRAENPGGPWTDLGAPTIETSLLDDSPPSPAAFYRVIPLAPAG